MKNHRSLLKIISVKSSLHTSRHIEERRFQKSTISVQQVISPKSSFVPTFQWYVALCSVTTDGTVQLEKKKEENRLVSSFSNLNFTFKCLFWLVFQQFFHKARPIFPQLPGFVSGTCCTRITEIIYCNTTNIHHLIIRNKNGEILTLSRGIFCFTPLPNRPNVSMYTYWPPFSKTIFLTLFAA